MRDLTAEELAKCPSDCDYYNIIDGDVYFTNVLGVGVYDISGNKVDDSLLDGIFKKSRHIEKPFEIAQHEWSDCRNLQFSGRDEGLDTLCFKVDAGDGVFAFFDLDKLDSIAIAKALGVTAEDLK